jgi:hypothetical protein
MCYLAQTVLTVSQMARLESQPHGWLFDLRGALGIERRERDCPLTILEKRGISFGCSLFENSRRGRLFADFRQTTVATSARIGFWAGH